MGPISVGSLTRNMRTVPLAMVALLLPAISLLASDITLNQTSIDHGHEWEQIQLWSSRYMRINQPGNQMDFLVDFTQGVSYYIDHDKKLIQKMNWDDLEIAEKVLGEKLKNLPPLIQKALGANDAPVSVVDQGSEIILDRECHKWKIVVGPATIETSNDPSFTPPVPAIPYQRFLRLHTVIGQPQTNAAPLLKAGEELARVRGLALKYRIVLPIAGQTTTITTHIEEGPIPPSAFELPSDYQVEDSGKKVLENLGVYVSHSVPVSQVQPCSGI